MTDNNMSFADSLFDLPAPELKDVAVEHQENFDTPLLDFGDSDGDDDDNLRLTPRPNDWKAIVKEQNKQKKIMKSGHDFETKDTKQEKKNTSLFSGTNVTNRRQHEASDTISDKTTPIHQRRKSYKLVDPPKPQTPLLSDSSGELYQAPKSLDSATLKKKPTAFSKIKNKFLRK